MTEHDPNVTTVLQRMKLRSYETRYYTLHCAGEYVGTYTSLQQAYAARRPFTATRVEERISNEPIAHIIAWREHIGA